MKKLIPILILFSGCGIHFTMVEGTWGTTGFMEEARKGTKNLQSGNQSAYETEYENPFEKKATYKQIYQQRIPVTTLPPSN